MSESQITSEGEHHKHETVVCKRCGSRFECKVGDVSNCQCSTIFISDATRKFLGNTFYGCLCTNCLGEIETKVSLTVDKTFPRPGELMENIHYYVENGLYVFTEQYHILRGSCCKSGCRHCPFGFNK